MNDEATKLAQQLVQTTRELLSACRTVREAENASNLIQDLLAAAQCNDLVRAYESYDDIGALILIMGRRAERDKLLDDIEARLSEG